LKGKTEDEVNHNKEVNIVKNILFLCKIKKKKEIDQQLIKDQKLEQIYLIESQYKTYRFIRTFINIAITKDTELGQKNFL